MKIRENPEKSGIAGFSRIFVERDFVGIEDQSGSGHAPRSVQTGDMSEFKAFERGGSPLVFTTASHTPIREMNSRKSDKIIVAG